MYRECCVTHTRTHAHFAFSHKQKKRFLPLVDTQGGKGKKTPTPPAVVEHGSNNVSRWMTWLPISLKNAAKCDKWYQLQNHSITESLNAKGAWEKLFTSHPRACRILSVEPTKKTLCFVCAHTRNSRGKKRRALLAQDERKKSLFFSGIRAGAFFTSPFLLSLAEKRARSTKKIEKTNVFLTVFLCILSCNFCSQT